MQLQILTNLRPCRRRMRCLCLEFDMELAARRLPPPAKPCRMTKHRLTVHPALCRLGPALRCWHRLSSMMSPAFLSASLSACAAYQLAASPPAAYF